MKVTAVNTNKVLDPKSKIVGFADIVLDGALHIYSMKIVNGQNGQFVAPPNRKAQDKWIDYIRFEDEDLKKEVETAILKDFNSNQENTNDQLPSQSEDAPFKP